MSYHSVPGGRPSGARASLRGLGTVLDSNPFTDAYYIALVEQHNSATGARSYGWSNYQYLSPWNAVTFAQGYDSSNYPTSQGATLYQWTGANWVPTSIQSVV